MTYTELLDSITIWLSIPAYGFIFKNWLNDRRLQENIEIFLQYKEEKIRLLQTLRRMHCSRSEIQGLLGAMYGEGRYTISFLAGEEFSQRLKKVQANDSGVKEIIVFFLKWLIKKNQWGIIKNLLTSLFKKVESKEPGELIIEINAEEEAVYEKFKSNIEKMDKNKQQFPESTV